MDNLKQGDDYDSSKPEFKNTAVFDWKEPPQAVLNGINKILQRFNMGFDIEKNESDFLVKIKNLENNEISANSVTIDNDSYPDDVISNVASLLEEFGLITFFHETFGDSYAFSIEQVPQKTIKMKV